MSDIFIVSIPSHSSNNQETMKFQKPEQVDARA